MINAHFVVIRTSGGKLVVTDTQDSSEQSHYGIADEVVLNTGKHCFTTYGAIGKMELKQGLAVAGEGGIVYLIEAKADTSEIKEDGGKFIIPSGITTTQVEPEVVEGIGYTSATQVAGKDSEGKDATFYDNNARTNSAYEIGTLAQLETFRDLVNGGFSFKGCIVELTSDIKLNDGWVPIGEGSRTDYIILVRFLSNLNCTYKNIRSKNYVNISR